MRSSSLAPALALALLALCAALPAAGATRSKANAPRPPADRCLECHAASADKKLGEPARQHPASAHRDESIGCAGCHGGDPEDPTVGGHSAAAGFVGRPSPERIPELCGGCHADARFVRRLSATLPIDQLALYSADRHGQLAAAGEPAAPVCTTCHGVHDIRPASDPRAPVSRARVAALCASCHADAKRLSGFRTPTDQLAQWSRSAHADAVRRGEPRAPSCAGCHGAHGQLSSSVSSVARVCSACHPAELERFRQSAHSKPFRRLGFAECVPCHGTHDVRAAGQLVIGLEPGSSCGGCHAADEGTRETTERLAALFRAATADAARARAEVARAAAAGLALPQTTGDLDDLAHAERDVRAAMHTVDPAAFGPAVAQLARRSEAMVQAITGAERARRTERVLCLALAAVLGVVAVLLAIGWARLARRRQP